MTAENGHRRGTTSQQMMPGIYLIEVFSQEEVDLVSSETGGQYNLYPVFVHSSAEGSGEIVEQKKEYVDLFVEAESGDRSDLYGPVFTLVWLPEQGIQALMSAISVALSRQ